MTNPGKAPDNDDLDIDTVMQEIREEVARKRGEGMFLPTENWPEPMHVSRHGAGYVDDGAILSALSLAEGNADAASRLV